MLTVNEIMTTELFTLHENNTVKDAIELERKHRIRHIPIISAEHHLIGLVSQRDLIAHYQQPDTMIEDIMHTKLLTVSPDACLRNAALLIQKHKIGCLPVTDGNKLVGIITDTDYVAVAINLMEQLEMAEPLDDEF